MHAYYYLTEGEWAPLPQIPVFASRTDVCAPRTEVGIPPSDVIVSGDSAGGTIAIQLVMYLRDHGYPKVGGVMLLSPWLDLTTSFGSWKENSVSEPGCSSRPHFSH